MGGDARPVGLRSGPGVATDLARPPLAVRRLVLARAARDCNVVDLWRAGVGPKPSTTEHGLQYGRVHLSLERGTAGSLSLERFSARTCVT